MKAVVRWLLRRGSLYLMLVLALAVGPLIVQAIRGSDLRRELMTPAEVSREFERLKADAVEGFKKRRSDVRAYSAAHIDERLTEARGELAVVSRQLEKKGSWFASLRPRSILERKRLQLQAAALRSEIRLLESARHPQTIEAKLRGVMAPTTEAIAAAKAGCERANEAALRFNRRYVLEKTVRNLLTDEAQRLTDRARTACGEYQARSAAREAALEQVEALRKNLEAAQIAYAQVAVDAEKAISDIGIDLSRTVRSVLLKAALVLAGIIATPYLIRIFFYFVLAPAAARRPSIRLGRPPHATAVSLRLPGASATSASIQLEAGEELLVRQGFLQSTSSTGAKATRALLDWRHPLSSLASGLVFLTRIEGAGETTTVSAVHDPFAEVAVLTLPPNGACVLQPRALAGLVQRTGRPVRITSHWRLGSLHAWLTLQLRYLMFHGPARLVIKGGRGVRVEAVERGRVFAQDQLVGFSADLAYSVTRTETFWPYFFGLEQLLKDKVEGGEGVLIVEEAPLAGAGRASPRRGLEGAADVLLKAVGL